MASEIQGIRHVKCPKCLKILPEPTDIPVYTCGGCGKILRAKYSFTNENVGSIQSNSSNALGSGALETRLPTSLMEIAPSSAETEKGVKEAVLNDQQSAQPLALSNHPLKAESLQLEEFGVDGRGSDERKPKSAIRPEAKRKEADLTSNVVTDHMLEVKEGGDLNVEVKSPKLGQLSHENLNDRNRRQDPADTVLHRDGHRNNLGSSTSKSHTYDNKVFSANTGYTDHVQNGATSSLESVGKNTNKAKRENLVVHAKTVEAEIEIQADDQLAKLPKGSYKPADTGTVYSPSKYKSRKQKDASLGSADFRPAKKWLEPEIDVSLSSPVKDEVMNEHKKAGIKVSSPSELNSLEHVRLEILKKVDELKYEISDLFHVCVENKGNSHIGGIREKINGKHRTFDLVHDRLKAHKKGENFQQQCKFAQIASLLPPGTCLHCLHEGCQKPPETSEKVLCSSNGFRRACSNDVPNHSYNKAQKHDQQQEKSVQKEKRKHTMHHCRPALGGAPFVVCYNCTRLLQLPLDFLVTRKQFYRLQCGACSTMLKYSFRSRNFGPLQTPIQETPNGVKHPPSEVDSSDDSILGLEISHLNNQQWDPISYPEEYGHSNGLIYSADDGSPLHVSRNSSGSLVLKNGKLHRLLGYWSASELLYRHSDTDEGYESTDPGTPQSIRESEQGYVRNKLKGKEIYIPQHSARKNYPGVIKIYDSGELPKRLRTAGGAF